MICDPRHAHRSSMGRALCCRITCFFSRPLFRSARGSSWTAWRYGAALFPLVVNLDQYSSFHFSKDSFHSLMGWGRCFRLLFVGDALLCHPVLGRFIAGSKRRTSLRHPSRYCQEFSRSLQNTITRTVREHCIAEVCFPTAASEESSGH